MVAEKATPDWERIEGDYRAGIKPLRLIGEENGITHGAINKRAKRDDWVRDLGAKIRAQADAKVSKAAVSSEVSIQRKATESQVIASNVDLQVAVRLSQRTDISRSRRLVMTLLEELELQTGSVGLLEQLSELLYDQNAEETTTAQQAAQNKRMELFNKVISLSGRTGTMKSLAESLKTLVALEREAFGIDTKPDGDGSTRGSVSYKANIPTRS